MRGAGGRDSLCTHVCVLVPVCVFACPLDCVGAVPRAWLCACVQPALAGLGRSGALVGGPLELMVLLTWAVSDPEVGLCPSSHIVPGGMCPRDGHYGLPLPASQFRLEWGQRSVCGLRLWLESEVHPWSVCGWDWVGVLVL